MENSDKNSEQSKQPGNAGEKSDKSPDNVSNKETSGVNKADNKSQPKAENASAKDTAVKAENAKKENVSKDSAKAPQKEQAKPAPNQPAAKKSGGGKFATVMSLLALGVGGTSMYMQVQPDAKIPYLSDKIAASSSSDSASGTSNGQIAELESKLAQFDTRLASLSEANTAQPAQSNNAQVEQLQTQLAQLQTRIEQQAASASSREGSDNVAQLQQSQQQLTQQLEQVLQENQNLKQTLAEVKQQQSYLSGTVDSVSSQIPKTQDLDVWVLRDVELTLKQANRRLNTVNDIDAVLPIMQSAQQQLLELKRPELSSVNNTLQQEIQSLQSIEVPSKSDMLQGITELAASSSSLPLIGDNKDEAQNNQAQTEQSATDKVADAGAGFLRSLTDMIEIEKDGQAIRPIVSNELRELARQRTQLILESANAAFISSDYELFEQRLNAAKDWVNEHFDTSAKVTQDWLTKLNALMANLPDGELPDISQSLAQLSQALKSGG